MLRVLAIFLGAMAGVLFAAAVCAVLENMTVGQWNDLMRWLGIRR